MSIIIMYSRATPSQTTAQSASTRNETAICDGFKPPTSHVLKR